MNENPGKVQKVPSLNSSSILNRCVNTNNFMKPPGTTSPRKQKVQMHQIAKKICHEDSESLLVPQITSSILQSVAKDPVGPSDL